MIDRVLAAIDGSETSTRSLETLIAMCADLKAAPDIVLLNVTVPMPVMTGMGVVLSDDVLQDYYAEAQEQALREARLKLEAAGLKFVERREIGDPADLVARVAQETGSKLIFIGSRGQGAIGSLLLGSTSHKVMHLTTIPVVITR